MFSDETIHLVAYSIENVLAEKLETILSRGTQNTRPRDFYDVWLLTKRTQQNIEYGILKTALQKTIEHRGTGHFLSEADLIMDRIIQSNEMHNYWHRYQQSYSYAAECTFEAVLDSIKKLIEQLS